jgi:hypothetical protein
VPGENQFWQLGVAHPRDGSAILGMNGMVQPYYIYDNRNANVAKKKVKM